MYTHVVVPVDEGPFAAGALAVAARVAAACDATLVLASFALTAQHELDLPGVVEARAREVGAIAPSAKVDAVTRVVDDVPAAIAALVEERPGSLVCMRSVGRARLAPMLGSVAEGVLSALYGPVLLVGPEVDTDAWRLSGPVLVSTDGSDTAEAVYPIVEQWAITLHLPVEVATVARPDRSGARDGADWSAAERAAHHFQNVVGRPVEFETLHDNDPVRALADHAAARHASLLAAATHGLTGLRRLALGSVAMGLVHKARVPVLVHRPPHLADAH